MKLNAPAVDTLCRVKRIDSSELARHIGKTRQFVGRLRRGERGASEGTIRGIAEALEVPVEAIVIPEAAQ